MSAAGPKGNVRLAILGALLLSLLSGYLLQLRLAAAARQQEQAERQVRLLKTEQQEVRGGHVPDSLLDRLSQTRRDAFPDAEDQARELRGERLAADAKDEDRLVLEPAVTDAVVSAEYLQFRFRERDAYRRLTKDVGPAREAGEAFLTAYISQYGARNNNRINNDELRLLGEKAIEAGSRDPLVRTHLANVQALSTGETEGPRSMLEEAVRELPLTGYPRIVKSYALVYLLDFDAREDWATQEKRLEAAVTGLVEWLAEEKSHPKWTRSAYERTYRLWRAWTTRYRDRLLAALLESETADPYVTHTLAGEYYVDRAWTSRGGGWAVEVLPEQWEGFAKYLEIATGHLQLAWSLRPDLPYAPERMIPIAMAGHGTGNSERFWFRRTLEGQCDLYKAYNSYLYSLTSRWGGSTNRILAVGRMCLETDRFDTLIPYQALEAVEKVRDLELDKGETLTSVPSAAELLKDFLVRRRAYIDRNRLGDLYEANGAYRSRMIQLLEACGLVVETGPIYRDAGADLNWTELRKGGRPGRYFAARRVAESDGNSSLIAALDERLRRPIGPEARGTGLDQIEAEWKLLRGQAAPAVGPHDFFRHTEVMIGQLRTFLKGEWVGLDPQGDLWGWEPYADRWDVENGVGVTLHRRHGGERQPCLRPLINPQPPLEVEVLVEVLDPAPYPEEIGIGWTRENRTDLMDREREFPLAAIEVEEQVEGNPPNRFRLATARVAFATRAFSRVPLRGAGPHRLKVKLWPGNVEYQADDAWFSHDLPQPVAPDGFLAFGATWPPAEGHDGRLGSFRLSGVRYRRLTVGPPPVYNAPREERIRYWAERRERDPDDLVARVSSVRLRLELHEYAEALADAEALLRERPAVNQVRVLKGMALRYLARYPEAVRELQAALEEWQDTPDACWVLAEIFAGAPDPAVRSAEKSRALAESSLNMYRTLRPYQMVAALAAAHAESGEFPKAVELQEEALRTTDATEREIYEERLERYRQGKPFRLPTEPESKRKGTD
ncbi:hypothetical protein [Planctomyces sp. SH-PL14]|uniref:hypothetical protein n=1 Tax=Planctomyces sp. SH-PL14 TaxID=1632864 RepID=UPI00078E4ECC|nr:hypothetical protein [Planctomyces sp. SH-PL14]AMV20828.1 hypothetical protein VT03_23200 [Planctomyces sp. SH-PL14]